jgi:hypothetical protein
MHSSIDLQELEDESREVEEEIQEAIAEPVNETIDEEDGGTYAHRVLKSFEDQITDRLREGSLRAQTRNFGGPCPRCQGRI